MDLLHRDKKSDHEKRDWSDLNPDLLRLISRNLCNLFDFVRFRKVCKHWRSATPASNHHPLLPCLLGLRSNSFLLYSLPYDEIHKFIFPDSQGEIISLPEKEHVRFTGSIEHPILAGTVDPVSWSLINPLTNNEVILPPINNYCFPCNMIGLNHVAVYGCVKNSNTHYLAWYQNSEGKWVTIEKNLTERGPIAYYKGMYYCVVEETGATEVIHATTGEIMSTIPYPDPRTSDPYFLDDENYFVESSGDLLLVCQFLDYISNGAALIKFHFEIYRLNQLENGDPVWVKMSNFADRALFLASSSGGFTVRATDFDRFRGNCVYYSVGALTPVKNSWPILVNYLMRYDIENRCWEEELPYPFHESVTWIMPSLQ